MRLLGLVLVILLIAACDQGDTKKEKPAEPAAQSEKMEAPAEAPPAEPAPAESAPAESAPAEGGEAAPAAEQEGTPPGEPASPPADK